MDIIRLIFRLFALLAFSCSCSCGWSVAAESWPRFRGFYGTGISTAADVPSKWSQANYRWVTELPGVANSSPVIWQDRLFVTAADDKAERRWLICLSTADGGELWRAESAFGKYKKHKNNSYASSTPAVDDKHVYQLWHSRQQTSLIAFDHDGSEVWRYELGPYLHGRGGATSPIWHIDPFGRESQRALASPIIAGDLVIAGSGAVGGDRTIVAIAVAGQTKAREVYRLIRQSPHVPTPLAIGDYLYLWNDGGIVPENIRSREKH